MNNRSFPVGTYAVILAASIASWWLAEHGQIEPEPDTQIEDPKAPDYYVNDLRATTMTSEGNPARVLNTPHMRHLPGKDVTELQTPQFSVYQDEGSQWQVNAEHGQISADGEFILLQGDVTIENAGNDGERPMRLLTRDLRIQPARDYAETDEPVTVNSDGDQIDAIGMRAWLRHPTRLKFLSRVRGHYVPR